MQAADPDYSNFLESLKKRLKEQLPGLESQLKMAPVNREHLIYRLKHKTPPRQSAVLILLFPHLGNLHTVFIKRNIYNGVHSGQVAFPGGQFEKYDNDLYATALREAEEELGIDPTSVVILGSLTKLYIPPSNFDVMPVVAFTTTKPIFRMQPAEVADIFITSLSHLADPETCQNKRITYADGRIFQTPCFMVDDHMIWGATSMILNELIEILQGVGI